MIIKRIEAEPATLTRILSDNKGLIREMFGEELQEKWIDLNRAWVYAKDWHCKLITDTGVIYITVRRGAVTDFNSIPAVLESIFKRDEGFVSGLVHDALFALQPFSFETTNSIFRQTNLLEGVGVIKSWFKWRGVESCIAREVWDAGKPNYEKRWYSVQWLDK